MVTWYNPDLFAGATSTSQTTTWAGTTSWTTASTATTYVTYYATEPLRWDWSSVELDEPVPVRRVVAQVPAVESPAQRQQAAEAQQANELAERPRAKERREAEARARELLLSMLDDDQRASYEHDGSFVVEVVDRRYQLTGQRAGGVYLLGDLGRRLTAYCIHYNSEIPMPDQLLAQKLLLETDEREFKRIANATQLADVAA